MQQLPQELIIKALALTGKPIEDMIIKHYTDTVPLFSIENFCFFLLSPDFIKKYIYLGYGETVGIDLSQAFVMSFAKAIYEYQKGNSQPLIDLLSKI